MKVEVDAAGHSRARYVGRARGGQGLVRPAVIDLEQAVRALSAARDELKTSLDTADERQRERLQLEAYRRVALGIRFATSALVGRKPPKRQPPAGQLRLKLRR